MVLHSSLATATAAAHTQELIAEARRHRQGPTAGPTLRRLLARLVHGPDPADRHKSDADRR